MIAALAALAVAWGPLASAAPKPPRYYYFVDVRRAVLSTASGKLVSEELAREDEHTNRDLNERENALAELEKDFLRAPAKSKIAEYDRQSANLEAAVFGAEDRIAQLEMKKVVPLANDVRAVIRELNRTNKYVVLLERDLHVPLNINPLCDATDWLVGRLEKPGKKPLEKRKECAVRFFLYIDVERLKLESKSSAASLGELEKIREERLQEIVLTSTATPLTRFQLYRRYTEEEDARKIRERALQESMIKTARSLVARTSQRMSGVVFLASNSPEKLTPSCEVTPWMIHVANGTATADDVARDCPCVWLGPKGAKLRVARDCSE
jgi:Skp family chaperone for outer membrane proteins